MRRRAAGLGRNRTLFAYRFLSVALTAAALLNLALTTHVYAQRAVIDDLVAPADPKAEFETKLCKLIEAAATKHGIPSDFFTRLLWKESRFRSDALSPKGAQGIAQFMPDTAAERGLARPVRHRDGDPGVGKLPRRSQSPLRQSRPRRSRLQCRPATRVGLARGRHPPLPFETQDFVLSITGTDAETWARAGRPSKLRRRRKPSKRIAQASSRF